MTQREGVSFDLHGLTLVAVAGAWIAGMFCASLVAVPLPVLLIGAGGALLATIPLWRDQWWRFGTFLACCLLLGAWRYTVVLPANNPQTISAFIGVDGLRIRGSVAEEPKIEGRSRVLIVGASKVSKDGGVSWQDVDGRILVRTRGVSVENPYGANYGDAVELQGKLQTRDEYSPPSIFASMIFPRISVKGAGGNPLVAWLYHLRVRLAYAIAQALPQPEAALLIAVFLSMHTPALQPLIPVFNVTGTAHLIAPSGFKVTLLAGFVSGSAAWFHKKRASRKREPVGQKKMRILLVWRQWLITLLVVVCIAAYTILSGAGPAALRAGAMGMLLVVAPRMGRIYNIYTSLALTALLMSLIDPFVLWDTGFQLSFLGTLGIVRLTPIFQRLLRPVERLPAGHYLVEIIAVTLAAQVATLPIFAAAFLEISLVAPLANILTVPLLSAMIVLGLFVGVAGLITVPVGMLCGWVAWPVLWYIVKIVQWCASLPGAYIIIKSFDPLLTWCYYALLVSVWSVVMRRWDALSPSIQSAQSHFLIPGLTRQAWQITRLSVAVLVILVMGGAAITSHADGALTVSFLDVGPADKPAQGEAILIQTPDNKTALIDGGLDTASLSQALDSRFPLWQRSLDVVLLTAARADHITGLQDIVNRYQIGEVIDAGMLHPSTTYTLWRRTISEHNFRYIPVVQGMTIPVGIQVALQVLWPVRHLHNGSDEVRDNGLVVRLVAPGLRILLLGATAQSKYALTGLLGDLDMNYLQAEIVQIVGEVGKMYPDELKDVLQRADPSLVVITPASMSAKQLKMGHLAPPVPPLSAVASWQVVQTGEGTVEISSRDGGWSMNIL